MYDLQTPRSNRTMANIDRNIEVQQASPAVAPVHLQDHYELANPYFPYDPTTTHHPLQPELLANFIVIPPVAQQISIVWHNPDLNLARHRMRNFACRLFSIPDPPEEHRYYPTPVSEQWAFNYFLTLDQLCTFQLHKVVNLGSINPDTDIAIPVMSHFDNPNYNEFMSTLMNLKQQIPDQDRRRNCPETPRWPRVESSFEFKQFTVTAVLYRDEVTRYLAYIYHYLEPERITSSPVMIISPSQPTIAAMTRSVPAASEEPCSARLSRRTSIVSNHSVRQPSIASGRSSRLSHRALYTTDDIPSPRHLPLPASDSSSTRPTSEVSSNSNSDNSDSDHDTPEAFANALQEGLARTRQVSPAASSIHSVPPSARQQEEEEGLVITQIQTTPTRSESVSSSSHIDSDPDRTARVPTHVATPVVSPPTAEAIPLPETPSPPRLIPGSFPLSAERIDPCLEPIQREQSDGALTDNLEVPGRVVVQDTETGEHFEVYTGLPEERPPPLSTPFAEGRRLLEVSPSRYSTPSIPRSVTFEVHESPEVRRTPGIRSRRVLSRTPSTMRTSWENRENTYSRSLSPVSRLPIPRNILRSPLSRESEEISTPISIESISPRVSSLGSREASNQVTSKETTHFTESIVPPIPSEEHDSATLVEEEEVETDHSVQSFATQVEEYMDLQEQPQSSRYVPHSRRHRVRVEEVEDETSGLSRFFFLPALLIFLFRFLSFFLYWSDAVLRIKCTKALIGQ